MEMLIVEIDQREPSLLVLLHQSQIGVLEIAIEFILCLEISGASGEPFAFPDAHAPGDQLPVFSYAQAGWKSRDRSAMGIDAPFFVVVVPGSAAEDGIGIASQGLYHC